MFILSTRKWTDRGISTLFVGMQALQRQGPVRLASSFPEPLFRKGLELNIPGCSKSPGLTLFLKEELLPLGFFFLLQFCHAWGRCPCFGPEFLTSFSITPQENTE